MPSAATALPPRPFAGFLVRRTLLYWAGARAILFFWGGTLFADPNYALAVLAVVLIALRVELRMRRMEVLLDDLGRGVRSMLLAPALAVFAVEVLAFVLTVRAAE